ncbi:MAG TPA: efflux RND transporter permease subunit, partial [Deltaproteobacteria bacterium]|nr:efflux RND transporter permease subunit [Deltaproteobacteria bacterium]
SVGEYTFAIFAVTTAALVISWVVSVYFVPYLGARLLRTRPHVGPGEGAHELFDTPFYARFRKAVNWCVRYRWITIGVTLLTFVLGVVGMGRVQQQFFPDSSRPELLVDLWLPEGSTVSESEALARRFEKRIAAEPGVSSVTTWIGSGVPRFYLPLDQIFQNTNVSQTPSAGASPLIVDNRHVPTRDPVSDFPPSLAAASPSPPSSPQPMTRASMIRTRSNLKIRAA